MTSRTPQKKTKKLQAAVAIAWGSLGMGDLLLLTVVKKRRVVFARLLLSGALGARSSPA